MCSETKRPVELADDKLFDIGWKKIPGSLTTQFLDGVWNQTILPNRLDRNMWTEHYNRLHNHAQAGWGKLFKDATDLKEWNRFQAIEENLARFAAGKQNRIVEELRRLKAKGLSRADFDKKAARLMNLHNRQYFRAELQAATAAAQAAESWAVFESRAYLYPNLKYMTAGDERVRDSHRILDEVIKPISDPFWDMYYPPNGWNCRCTVVQTDEPPTPGREVDFDPPKGFRDNVGKTGKLFGDDHPYFNMSALDREAVYDQAKAFHAAITRTEVRQWAKSELVPLYKQQLPGMPTPATITNGEVKNITGKPHSSAAARNNLLYMLMALSGELLTYVGSVADRGTHPGVQRWFYYMLESGGRKYFFNFVQRVDDAGVSRIGLHNISDKVPAFGSGP